MIISLDLSSRFFFATHLCLLSGSVTTSVVGDARDDLCGFCAAEAAPTRRRRRRLIRSDLKSYPMIVAVCCVSSFYMIIKCSAAKLLPHRVVARPQISRKRRQMIFFLVQHTHTHRFARRDISRISIERQAREAIAVHGSLCFNATRGDRRFVHDDSNETYKFQQTTLMRFKEISERGSCSVSLLLVGHNRRN